LLVSRCPMGVERRTTSRTVLAGAIVCAALRASPALASDTVPLTVEWDKLGVVLRDGPGALLPPGEGTSLERTYPGGSGESPWIGLSPRLSIVARDWSSSQRLWGYMGLTDQLRLSRSSRMVVSRIRLADGRLAPFAQLGLGQWRVDTAVVPALPSDVELAAQIGAGFELRVTRGAVLALEVDRTDLYRPGRDPLSVACPHLWGALLAARAVF
jgi:hypothetical protein